MNKKETMTIVDINGQERTINKIGCILHNRKNMITVKGKKNVDGELVDDDTIKEVDVEEEYVEVNIVGKTGREWTEWYPREKFEEMNPKVKL